MDAHQREYAGAITGFQETNGRRFTPSRPRLRDGRVVDTWSAGDYVSFSTDEGDRRAGYVVECLDDSGYGIYHVKSHRAGGGTDHFSVDGFQIHIF